MIILLLILQALTLLFALAIYGKLSGVEQKRNEQKIEQKGR